MPLTIDATEWNERQRKIHKLLMKGQRCTTAQLAEDLEVTPRTIRRDIKEMQDQGLPLFEDNYVYSYTNTNFEVNNVNTFIVSSEMMLGLSLIKELIRQYEQTHLHEYMAKIFDSLTENLGTAERDRWLKLEEKIRFCGMPAGPLDEEVLDVLIRALAEDQCLTFGYPSRQGPVVTRNVQPLGITIYDNKFQLVGYEENIRKIITFHIPRITDIEIVEKSPRVPTLDQYLVDSIGGRQSTGDTYEVVIRFSEAATRDAKDYVITDNQQLDYDEQGRVLIKLKTSALYFLKRELLAWGGACEVLEPPILREMMIKDIEHMRDAYSISD